MIACAALPALPYVREISPYIAGKPIDELAREFGLDPESIVKLASNESPDGPFPGVVEAATMALAQSNRYPDDDLRALPGHGHRGVNLGCPGRNGPRRGISTSNTSLRRAA